MSDVLSINGSAVNLVTSNAQVDGITPYVRGGYPELHFSRLLGSLAALPDPWSGKPCTLTQLLYNGSSYNNVTVFSGDVVGYADRYVDGFGWLREYRALGLAHRADYIPVTDSFTLTDTSEWNLPSEDPLFIASRAGQTVGQIVAAILTQAVNGAPLNAAGLGAYTSTAPYTLPSATTTDLSALSIIPVQRAIISGERILQALEGFVQTWHPNHYIFVQTDGTIRFIDLRLATDNTFTLNGSDPRVAIPSLVRDYSDCYSQVLIRGNTLCVPITLQDQPWPGSSLTDGGLQEDFAWGSYTSAAAKAAWVPSNYSQPNQWGAAVDQGTCTCPDTQHITVTSANTSLTWASNAWGQGAGEGLGYVVVTADALNGSINQFYTARIAANTALSAGGSSTFTLIDPLPVTTYTNYQLFGLGAGPNIVGRRYKASSSAVAAALQLRFPYPRPYLFAGGSAAEMVTAPMGTVMWGGSGTPPNYTAVSDAITIDPDNGLVYFDKPVQVVAGGLNTPVTWPQLVQAFLPIAVGQLEAWAPSSSTYSGTLHTIEGISRTKTITVPDWRDHSNDGNMAAFAQEMLDSLSNVVVEGSLPYCGLLNQAYYTPGQAVSIAGLGYTTGWESLALPIASIEVQFHNDESGATSYTTMINLSNRRGRLGAGNFLRPNIVGVQFGGSETFRPGGPTFVGDAVSAPTYQEGSMPTAQQIASMVSPPSIKQMNAADQQALRQQDQALAAATAVPTHQQMIQQEQQAAQQQQQAIDQAAGYENGVNAGAD